MHKQTISRPDMTLRGLTFLLSQSGYRRRVLHAVSTFRAVIFVFRFNKERVFCTMSGQDNYAELFSGKKIAMAYSQFRPEYNTTVYNTIFDYCKEGTCRFEMALDVGCGTGQSTVPLSDHFKQVIGTDVSEQQIKQARLNRQVDNISFRVGPGEDLSFCEDDSVDLITCAQALHWLDREKFFSEVSRVLKPGASVVAYGYGLWKLDIEEAENIVNEFYNGPLGPYWGMGRQHVEQKYSQICLPFPGWIRNDDIWLEKQFTVDDFCGYLSSWSAYHKYKEAYPEETELSTLWKRLKEIYSEGSQSTDPAPIIVRWPVFMLLGRKPT